MHQRPNFLLWEEGHPPRFVIELTSSSTRKADIGKKFELYRDVLKVREYFLFDPNGDYLKPPMQGWRLVKGVYKSIRPVEGRLPSETTGLHLERDGKILRLWNPETKTWLPTPMERVEEAERSRDDAQRARDDAQRSRDDAERARDDAQQARDDAQQARDDAQRRLAAALEELRQLKKIPPVAPGAAP